MANISKVNSIINQNIPPPPYDGKDEYNHDNNIEIMLKSLVDNVSKISDSLVKLSKYKRDENIMDKMFITIDKGYHGRHETNMIVHVIGAGQLPYIFSIPDNDKYFIRVRNNDSEENVQVPLFKSDVELRVFIKKLVIQLLNKDGI